MRISLLLVASSAVLVVWMGCNTNRSTASQKVSVPTPQMPATWQLEQNDLASADDVSSMGSRMGAQLLGVRNTVYTVDGQRVQVNTIITASPVDAENAMRFLLTLKSEEALLRRGTTVYEFVGQNDVLPHIRAGREHLESHS